MKLCSYTIYHFLEILNNLEHALVMEVSSPYEMAKQLYDIGVLPKQSYLAVNNSFIDIITSVEVNHALAKLLFDELVDPTTFDIFKDYCIIKLPQTYDLLSSMGEYYNDNFSYKCFLVYIKNNVGWPFLVRLLL